ncbi:MAG: TonB-dependent receptor [Pseudomonadales bacterium]|nr:TonB-dependent receptor [Pseudomonadales bacterium]
MKRLQKAFTPLFYLSISGALAISATGYADHSNTEHLPELLVSATRSAHTPSTLPAAQIVISRDQILQSGSNTVAEVLASVAGIQLTDLFGNGTSVTVGMRGFGDNASLNSLIMVDGRRLNNALDIGSPRLSGISLDQIESIEIISGSAGVLFGENAVGGVINIITRSPGNNSLLEITAGSYGNQQYRASIGRKINQWDISASAEKRSADNYRDHSESDTKSLDLELGYALDHGRIWLGLNGSDEYQQLPGALFAAQYDNNRKASRNDSDFLDGEYRTYQAGLSYALSEQWQLEAELSSRSDNIDGSQEAFGSASTTRQERDQSSFYPRLIGQFSQPNGTMILTTGFDYDNGDYFLSSVFGTQQAEQKIHSFYAQLLYPVLDKVNLQVGARYARLNSDIKDSYTFPAGTDQDDSVTRYSIGLDWTPVEWVKLFLRRDENYRFAKIEEHTNQFNFVGVYQPLDSQLGTSLETGAVVTLNQTVIDISLYELKLSDEIVYDSTTFSNINLDTTKRTGANFNVTSQLTSAFSVYVQLALVDAKFDSGPYSNKEIPWVAQQNISAGVDYLSDKLGNFHLEWLRAGDRYAASDFANGFAKIDAQNQLNFAWRIEIEKFSIDARINNLLDDESIAYATSAYNPATFANEVGFYAAPERNFLITVSYHPDR